MLNTLKELCLLNGVSGHESKVAEYIAQRIQGKCDFKYDNMGNIIAFKKGKKTPKNKVLISAHMDEVGFVVNFINSDGTLKITSVGGIDARVVFGRQVVVGEKHIVGVIGSKAVHNLTPQEKETAIKIENMYVDIGATSREEASMLVDLGEYVAFKSDFLEYGEGMIKSKAIDDRAGCAVMLELIDSELEYDTYFSFVTQEEIGLRGAKVASYSVNPDIAIVLESTTASDIPSVSGEKRVCEINKGAVISFMDRSTIYNKELYNIATSICKEQNIAYQTKTMVAGGNDSGAIHVSRGGVKTLAISVPCRYLHSPSCVISNKDLASVFDTTKALLTKVYEI